MLELSSPFKLIETSFKIFFDKKNILYFVLIYVFLLPFQVFKYFGKSLNLSVSSPVIVTTDVLYLLIYLLSSVAGILAVKGIIEGKALKFGEIYPLALKKFWKFLLLSILIFVATFFSFLLVIIPGIIVSTWLSFATYIFVDQNMGVMASIKKSREMVKGRFWSVLIRFVVFGLFSLILGITSSLVPYGIGSSMITLLGALFVIPSYLLYKEIKN